MQNAGSIDNAKRPPAAAGGRLIFNMCSSPADAGAVSGNKQSLPGGAGEGRLIT